MYNVEKEPREHSFEEIVSAIPRDLAETLDEQLEIDPSTIGSVAAEKLISLDNTRDFGDSIEGVLNEHPSMKELYSRVDQNRGANPGLQKTIQMRRVVAVAAFLYDLEDWIIESGNDISSTPIATVHSLDEKRRKIA